MKTVTVTTEEAIIDALRALGPQSVMQLRYEVHEQSSEVPSRQEKEPAVDYRHRVAVATEKAIKALLRKDWICLEKGMDEEIYDLTDAFYLALQDGGDNHCQGS